MIRGQEIKYEDNRRQWEKWLWRSVETAEERTAGKDSSESGSPTAEWKQAGVLSIQLVKVRRMEG